MFFFLHHLLLFIFTSKSPQNDISVWLENLPKTTFLHESIFCFQIPKSPQNDIFRSNFTRLDSLLFFFLHHLLLFIFTSKSPQNDISVWLENLPKTTFLHESIFCFQIPKSPQNDIFRSNFGSKFGLSWRSLRFAALRCCSYKVHYVDMVYGLKCCLKFWYNSCIFLENVFNGRSDRTEDRLGRVCFLGQCHLTFIWEEQKFFWSFFYFSE